MSLVRSRESVSTIRISDGQPTSAVWTSSITAPIEDSSFIVGMMTETSAMRAPCWVLLIGVSRSRGQRFPEELVSDVSEQGGAQPQERPERRLLSQHLPGPVATPGHPLLRRELLSARAVPHGLPQEVVRRVACPVVDDRVGAEADRVARPDRADVQVDVLGRDEPLVEAADLVEHGLAVGQVRGRIGDVRALDDEFDPLELLERPVADLDRPARDDVMLPEALPELANPERVRDRISIDERDGVPLRLPNPEVPPGPPRSPEDVQMDEVVPLLVPPHDVSGRVLAVRIDDDQLDRRLLDDEAVQEGRDVPRFVADGRDDADEQCGSYWTRGNDGFDIQPRGTIFIIGPRLLPRPVLWVASSRSSAPGRRSSRWRRWSRRSTRWTTNTSSSTRDSTTT